jgi:NitT/TauT family transport system permease protein
MRESRAVASATDWRLQIQLRGHWIIMLAIIAAILGTWIYVSDVVGVPYYILPSPLRVVKAFRYSITRGGVWGMFSHIRNLAFSLRTCLLGFSVGALAGLLIGTLNAEFPLFKRAFLPYISAIQSLPKLSLAPLMIVWLGIGDPPKIVLSAILTFFPLLINTTTGLESTDPMMLELMRSLKASRWQTFRMVKFPGALPLVFTGLQMSIVYALLGTMLGEFLAGDKGVGMLIRTAVYTMETPDLFSLMFLLAAAGFIMQQAIRLVRRRVLFWTEQIEIAAS